VLPGVTRFATERLPGQLDPHHPGVGAVKPNLGGRDRGRSTPTRLRHNVGRVFGAGRLIDLMTSTARLLRSLSVMGREKRRMVG
jgi:hypothetical protein